MSVKIVTPKDKHLKSILGLLTHLGRSGGGGPPFATKEYVDSHPIKIVIDNDVVVGVIVWQSLGDDTLWVKDLVVKASRRNEGIGKRLMNCVKAKIVKVYALPTAIGFYKKCGFKITKCYPHGKLMEQINAS
jgi:N-acetylglutamate synthase-like GNAT family acetyltransferase